MRLSKVRNRTRTLFFSSARVAKLVKESGDFERRIGTVLSRLSSKKVKHPEKVVNLSFSEVQRRLTKEIASWQKFLRNTLSTDLQHYQHIMVLSRSKFILELVTFVETTLTQREKAREKRLKNGG